MREIALYDYQAQAVEALRENITKGVRRQVLCAPTGSGKTVMAAYLLKAAHAKGSRAYFLCDRVALINQTSAVLDDYGIPHGVIQADHWRYLPDEPIQVASQQTLERRGWPANVDLMVVDECHTMRDQTTKQIAKTGAVVLGLTATPFTPGMGKVYEAVVSVTTTNRLIEDGRLAPFTIFAPAPIDMEGARVTAGEWSDKAAEERAMRVVGDVVKNYLKFAEGRKFIAFGATIAHCEQIQRELVNAGVRCELYTAYTSSSEREAILDEYRKPTSQIRGLVSVAALAKGFDVPDVSCLIIARPLRSSFAEHIQIVGRGLRADSQDPEKKCVIIDHAENCLRFGPRMAEFFENSVSQFEEAPKGKAKKVPVYDYYETYETGDRVRHLGAEYEAVHGIPHGCVPGVHHGWELVKEKEEQWRKCHQCDHVHKHRPECPHCGYEYPRRETVHEEGELTNIEFVAAQRAEQARWWSGILWIAERSKVQKTTGFAAHKFRDKFGVWPTPAVKSLPSSRPDTDVERWMTGQRERYMIAKKAAGAR
jgi:DNA repair protein RadD